MFSGSTSLRDTLSASCCPQFQESKLCVLEKSGLCWFGRHEEKATTEQQRNLTNWNRNKRSRQPPTQPPTQPPIQPPTQPPVQLQRTPTTYTNTTKTNSSTTTTTTTATTPRHFPAPPEKATKRPRTVPAQPLFNASSRPVVSASFTSKVDRTKRQRILDLFFIEFSRIYAPILIECPSIAHQHALQQENALQSKCSNPTMYSTLAMPILNRLKKRPVARDSKDVGIDGVWTQETAASGIAETSSANSQARNLYQSIHSLEKFKELVLSEADLEKHDYPTLKAVFPLEHLMNTPAAINSHDTVQRAVQCARCQRDFLPKHILDPDDWHACCYHTHRVTLQPANTTTSGNNGKIKIYPCCRADLTSQGCKTGPHVFKETAFADLNKRIPFIMLPDAAENTNDTALRIVGLDCEMSYTTGGMEVTRCTFVDVLQRGKIVVDELVKPRFPVLDLNTEFSGITDLSSAKYTLPELHAHLSKLLTRETIIIGHGLENDMTALRIIHTNVIDTCILYPRAQPAAVSSAKEQVTVVWKHSLKSLCEKVLCKKVQSAGSSGHDSAEDARAAVELCLFWMRVKHEKGTNYVLRDL